MSKHKFNLKNMDYRTFDKEIADKLNNGDQIKQTEGEEEEEYDPHLHRQIVKPTNNFETLIHILKACLGTGILAMPQAFMYAGMINGIISTICISILCTYCFHLMVKAQYVLCKQKKIGLLTYPESMKVACEVGPPCFKVFEPCASGITNFFLEFNQIGICCVYILFVAVNMKGVIEVYTETNLPKEAYIAFFFIPCLLIMSLPDLKILALFSTVANLIALATFCVVGYYVSHNLKNFSEFPAFGTLFNYPLYFGTALFSLQSVGVIITLENNMKNPKKFGGYFGVLNIGMVIVTTIYIVMSMLGYWRYGSEIQDSITLNFPEKDVLGQVIKILYSVAIFISYGLQGFVSVYILWTEYIEKCVKSNKLFWQYMLRISVVLISFILAATVPLLGYILSLTGAISLSALGIAFPAILDICAGWPDNLGRLKWKLIRDTILIIVGIIGLCAGSYSCIYSIVVELSKGRM